MENFSASTQHMILNELNSCMGSQAVHRIQYKLNLLSEDFFPLLGDKGTEIVNEVNFHQYLFVISCNNIFFRPQAFT